MTANNNTQTPAARPAATPTTESAATPTTEPAATPAAGSTVTPKDDRVDLFVEKGYANDEPNLIIAINGKNFVLPRGKTSKVPKYVADEYARSKRAREARDENIDKMLEASK